MEAQVLLEMKCVRINFSDVQKITCTEQLKGSILDQPHNIGFSLG